MSGTWSCGHERTPDNTVKCGVAGLRCATCRRAINARAARFSAQHKSDHRKPTEYTLHSTPARGMTTDEINARLTFREPCGFCGTRRDIGCTHYPQEQRI